MEEEANELFYEETVNGMCIDWIEEITKSEMKDLGELELIDTFKSKKTGKLYNCYRRKSTKEYFAIRTIKDNCQFKVVK